MNRSTQKAIPKIVKQFTSLFNHPNDADKFLAKLQNSDFQTALRHYTTWCQTKEGAIIEMINNLTIDAVESKMYCKEFNLKIENQLILNSNEEVIGHIESSNLDKIMAHAMPGYKTWEK